MIDATFDARSQVAQPAPRPPRVYAEQQREAHQEASFGSAQTGHVNPVRPAREHAYCVVDWDNCVNRGTRERATLNWIDFAQALREAGVVGGTSFAHHHSGAENGHWRALGLDPVSFHANVDETAAAALRYFGGISRRIILVGGDGPAYAETVRRLTARGVLVEVWARSHCVSLDLIRAADGYRSLDRFLHVPSVRQPVAAMAMAA